MLCEPRWAGGNVRECDNGDGGSEDSAAVLRLPDSPPTAAAERRCRARRHPDTRTRAAMEEERAAIPLQSAGK